MMKRIFVLCGLKNYLRRTVELSSLYVRSFLVALWRKIKDITVSIRVTKKEVIKVQARDYKVLN